MLRSLRKEIEDLFPIFPRKMAPQVKHERSSWQKNILLFGSKRSTVLQWWMADGTDWPLLHNVAKRVFLWQHQVLPQNVIFPPLGLSIQSYEIALATKVKKLVYVKTNSLQMSDVLLNDNYCMSMTMRRMFN
jgi:hypothetical protein